MSQVPPQSAKPGRPRNTAAQAAILTAARDILLRQGLGRLTIEGVAAQAGVGKPTIYRYWRNARELAMAALMAEPEGASDQPAHPTALARLQAQMVRLIETFATPRGRMVALTLAASDPDSELARAFRDQVILLARAEGRATLLAAETDGEVVLSAGIEVVLDLIYAPIFYRLLAGHLPLNQTFGSAVLDAVFAGITPRPMG